MTLILISPLDALRRRFRGTLLEPGNPGWDDATQAFNLTIRQEPALVAIPADEHDVIAVVDYAREQGLQVAAQRAGHNAAPLGALDDVILLRTDALRGVHVDAARRVARAGAGAKWGDLVPVASQLGLAALHGSTPNVSIAGYTLGGGVGWYARKLGLAADSVVAIELVTADGRLRRVDADHDPELFWALRGGGGNFGIVTAIEMRLFALPEVYAGVAFFAWERAHEVLHAWLDWTSGLPDEVTSVGRLLQFPPLPDLPDELRGKQFVVVEAVVMADQATGDALLAPIRALGPATDTFAMVPPAGISELHMDPPEPVPYSGESQMLGMLDHAAIDAFLEVAGPGSGSRLVSAEIRHAGGALARSRPGQGALGTLDAAFVTFALNMVDGPDALRETNARLALIADAFAPYDTGRQYLNFTEEATDPARFFRPEAHDRLRRARAQYDPEQLFRANHPISPAA